MRVVLGTDHRGQAIRPLVAQLVQRLHFELIDVGTHGTEPVDYPDIAAEVAQRIARGEADRGILVGGTGIGMCIAANKFPGIRAAACYDELTAELSRRQIDLNVLCLSADLLGELAIDRLVALWLQTPFEGGRHGRRLAKLQHIERGQIG